MPRFGSRNKRSRGRKERIEPRLNEFLYALYRRETPNTYQIVTVHPLPRDRVKDIKTGLRIYIDELATELHLALEPVFKLLQCALATLRKSGCSDTSTIGDVKNALIKAGVERGIVVPIAYIDYANCGTSDVLKTDENIFRPYSLKSVAFDYEKEIRFVLAARREIARDKRGILVTFEEADFFKVEVAEPGIQLSSKISLRLGYSNIPLPKRRSPSPFPNLFDLSLSLWLDDTTAPRSPSRCTDQLVEHNHRAKE